MKGSVEVIKGTPTVRRKLQWEKKECLKLRKIDPAKKNQEKEAVTEEDETAEGLPAEETEEETRRIKLTISKNLPPKLFEYNRSGTMLMLRKIPEEDSSRLSRVYQVDIRIV